MTAATVSPQRGSALPTTATSATDGWACSSSSISRGGMFSPRRMIMSLSRPRLGGNPERPSRPGRRCGTNPRHRSPWRQRRRANAIAERFIGTLRRECLDHLLIIGTRHLKQVLHEFVEHYNTHRPHRSLDQHPPAGRTPPPSGVTIHTLRRDRLGGLVHEYVQVA